MKFEQLTVLMLMLTVSADESEAADRAAGVSRQAAARRRGFQD